MGKMASKQTRTWKVVLAVALAWLAGHPAHVRAVADPGQAGPCMVSAQTVTIDGSLSTAVYYPSETTCGSGLSVPYPGIAFAHGFSMFGLSDGVADNAGNGEHLASWGYIVAIPALDDDTETRIGQMQGVLEYLEQATNTSGSFLYEKVDTARLAAAGYSLGGATVLALAARDARVRAVVALDPVYHEGGFGGEGTVVWDPAVEAPNIAVPAGILGAPPSNCNADSDYLDIYPLVGATHKASFHISEGSHCDFADPGNAFCGLTCGSASSARTLLSQKYMTAWFNYYLHLQTGYYTYLYGAEKDADISAGSIVQQARTAPKGLLADGRIGELELTWQRYNHPIVAGYNVYRKTEGAGYDGTPYAQVGTVSSYTDTVVTAARVYTYTICSRDPAGNEHQCAADVSASAVDPASLARWSYLPLIVSTVQ
jgi:predicted dienelactone hydrolase